MEEGPSFRSRQAPDGGDNEAQIRGGDAIWPTDLRADFGQGRRHQILRAVNFQHVTATQHTNDSTPVPIHALRLIISLTLQLGPTQFDSAPAK